MSGFSHNDRVRVVNPSSKLYGKTGHVVGYPNLEALVDLERPTPGPKGRVRKRFSFYLRELEKIGPQEDVQ